MKPSPLLYAAPRELDEALAGLAEIGDDAKLLAGGQSLMPLLNLRLSDASHLIDLAHVARLREAITVTDDEVVIPAMTRHSQLEDSADIARTVPLIAEAAPWIAHRAIRNRGTIGGTVAHADPAAEMPAVLLALDARFRVAGGQGSRDIAAEEFFLGYFTTALEPTEILTDVIVPRLGDRSGSCWIEFAQQHGDYALVGVGVVATFDDNDRIVTLRCALSGVAGQPVRLDELADALVGQRLDRAAAEQFGHAASESVDPTDDLVGSSAYRQHLTGVLAQRALITAAERAGVQL